MLTSLYLNNFVIVSRAELPLASAESANNWLTENAMQSDGDCILRRLIRREGNSRGYINGRPVTMQQLRELGDELVDIHGQHEHQSLLRSDAQRQILDEHAKHSKNLQGLARLYDELQDSRQHLQRLLVLDEDGLSRLDLIRYQISELDALGLSLDDIHALEDEHRRLANASDLLQGINTALNTLSEDERYAIDRLLGDCHANVQQLEDHDSSLSELSQLITSASIQIEEAVTYMRQYLDRLEISPERLIEVDRQIASLHDLARKHRVSVHDLPAQHEKLKSELDDLESGEERIAQLQEEIEVLTRKCMTAAKKISRQRTTAAQALSADVTARMQELGMQGGSFNISVSCGDQLMRNGLDKIEFMVAGNPGHTLMPLKRVASGGELSRIALALQVSATESTSIPTLVFDEIDVGIGGGVAEIVGRQLHRLGSGRQVLCITHLAQVAAYANQQLRISKTGDPVETTIEALGSDGRIEEIARMMGGVEITEQTRAHAREMLEKIAS
jgi:DNA repair protein RecN (Recombination protein N)